MALTFEMNKQKKEQMCDRIADEVDCYGNFGFKFIIEGNSGNCTINAVEEELIIQEIENIFKRRAITSIKVTAHC